MDFKEKNGIKYLSYIDNDKIVAGVSTRIGGCSTGGFESLNLGLNTSDDKDRILKNRATFFETVAPGMSVLHLNQTHSNVIHDADDGSFQVFCDGDGLVTTEPGKLLCVTLADCGSVVFHDDEFTIACAIHCGWRGTRDGIVKHALDLLSEWTDLANITAYVGPMIRQASYEVGAEFTGYFGAEYFSEKGGKLTFDLNAVIVNTLTRAGLNSIHDCAFDTFFNSELFFSHRRDARSGRMCAYVGLRAE